MADENIDETHVPIASIHQDPQFQMRVMVNRETVSEYAELIRGNKGKWPFVEPVKLVRVKGKKGEQPTLVLVDGWHRIAAAKEADEDHVVAVIIDGTAEAAFKQALGANSRHGLPRTNGDKRRAVAAALERYASWDNRKIAKLVGVSHTMVNDARKRLEAASSVAPGPGAPALPKMPVPVAGDAAGGAGDADLDVLGRVTGEAQELLENLSQRVPASMRGRWYGFLKRYAALQGGPAK